MDFMKVFDQTVREIKREVNLKVLKVPEIEQKVLDATENEPWGPHGTVLAEIAQATKKFSECQIVMNVLWTRLTETGKNWRFVYKALAVIEYLVAHGSERAVDDITEHTYQISSLASFEYVEPSGKDLGINVRKKAETIVALLNNKDKIQELRNKATENRDKYVGLSSSRITYKSGVASFGSVGFRSSDRYGGFGNSGDDDSINDSYKDKDRYDEDKYDKPSRLKKETSHNSSKVHDSTTKSSSKTSSKSNIPVKYPPLASQSSSAPLDEDDEFDPRGTSSAKSSVGSNQVDPFGQNIVTDLLDAPISVPSDKSILDNDPLEVDLFADAAFVSAETQPTVEKTSVAQTGVDLFATQSPSSPAVSSTMDLFAAPDAAPQLNVSSSKSNAYNNLFDPFATIPLDDFSGSSPVFAHQSDSGPLSTVPNQASSFSENPGINVSMHETKSPQKDAFQVKSGIWADSLSRGLIDLNITAPKKVNLADVGIVGGLSGGSEEKGPLPSFYMGQAMGTGSVFGKPGFTSTSTNNDDFFSSLSSQQYEYKSFQK